MSDELRRIFEPLLSGESESVDIGRRVFCDICNKEWTDDCTHGGFLFCSKAVCPACAERELASIRSYGEEHYIKARCPEDMSFADWCRWLRGGDNTIRITKGSLQDLKPKKED